MRFRRMAFVTLAAALSNGPASGQGLTTDCAQLRVRLERIPEAADARCSGDENGWFETIDASGPSTTFYIRRQFALGDTYFWRLRAAEIVKRLAGAEHAEAQGEEFDVENFDVIRYRSTGDSPAACFAFVAYAGHVDHTTGYRHSLVGVYCDRAGKEAEVADARIHELLGGIEADFW